MSRNKIVIIEDETDIVEVITYNLKREGYQVFSVGRGDEGINLVRAKAPVLILLDLMLPGMDGLAVCQQLKSDPLTRDIPIIIISAKDDESDVVIGLGLGADDYVPKPFSPKELVARVKAVLRRGGVNHQLSNERITVGELSIDSARHEVMLSGELIKLTATEFKILHQLASQPGRAFTREQLLNRVVGEGVVVVDRNIDVHIRSVRKALRECSSMIQTIRGIGYRFDATGV